MSGFAGINRAGTILQYDGILEKDNTTVKYKGFTLSNIRDHPSICEVYFILESKVRQQVSVACNIAYWIIHI